MCQICDQFDTGKLTAKNAYKAIGEALTDTSADTRKHLMDLSSRILDKELPSKTNSVLDEKWWNETHPKDDEE